MIKTIILFSKKLFHNTCQGLRDQLPGILPFLGYFSQISVGAEQISIKRSMRVAFRNPSEYAGDLRKSQLELTVHSC